MNKFIIQSTGFSSSYIEDVINSLNRLDIKWQDFGVIPNETTITNLENILAKNTKLIARGGVKFLTMLNEVGDLELLNKNLTDDQIKNKNLYFKMLVDSVDYDIKSFDQEYYASLDLPLLNYDAEFKKFKDIKNHIFTGDYFVKPSKDLKSFNGGIIQKGETLEIYIKRTPHIKNYEKEIVVIAHTKKIFKEYRFFMYKDRIISSSQYMMDGKVQPDVLVPKNITEAALEYSKLYNPNDLYVMDLADTDGGIKIVEYNCWNASGFYYCDIMKIINEVNEIKQTKY